MRDERGCEHGYVGHQTHQTRQGRQSQDFIRAVASETRHHVILMKATDEVEGRRRGGIGGQRGQGGRMGSFSKDKEKNKVEKEDAKAKAKEKGQK